MWTIKILVSNNHIPGKVDVIVVKVCTQVGYAPAYEWQMTFKKGLVRVTRDTWPTVIFDAHNNISGMRVAKFCMQVEYLIC